MIEIFKGIPGYEEYYKVSNLGRVKRINTNKFLKLSETKKGYLSISVSAEGKKKYFVVHRLVALLFVKNPHKKPQVNHKDFNKKNNICTNLEWCSNRENTSHSFLNRKSSSKYVGVHYIKKDKIFNAQIHIENKTYSLGRSKIEKIAKSYYDVALENWNVKGIKPIINECKN